LQLQPVAFLFHLLGTCIYPSTGSKLFRHARIWKDY